MGVISVRLDKGTEDRLKQEARRKGLPFSNFLRQRLTGEAPEVNAVGLEERIERLETLFGEICRLLAGSRREQKESDTFTQFLIYYNMRLLLPKATEHLQSAWRTAMKKAKEQAADKESDSQ